MKEYALRNVIPIAGTGNREPCRGDEAPFRATLGFTPRWFAQRMKVDFSERWHHDPLYRFETLKEMRAYLQKHFPSISAFEEQKEDGIDYTCATLNGVEGSKIILECYGQEIHYAPDDWPDVTNRDVLTREALEELIAKPFDPETNPAFVRLKSQMVEMKNRWGKVAGYLNSNQGILNTALSLRGQEIFLDMCDDPDFVLELFDHIFNTTLVINKEVQRFQRESGFEIDQYSSSNCVVNMISPAWYEEFVLPYDQKFSREFKHYGIHTCNWNATPYLESMRKVERMGYLDMGMNTDMRKARELFPDARRGVLYSPGKIGEAPLSEVQADFEKIYSELGPCDIILADVDSTVGEERVKQVLEIVDRVAAGKCV